MGTSANEYLEGPVLPVEDVDLHAITGRALSLLSGRLSYILGLTGPALTIDTACSSSLMACHLALQSIWAGESTSAIVAGVNLLLLPGTFVGFSRGGMMAADGRCKFGDASADGYVRGLHDGYDAAVAKEGMG